MNEFAKHQLCAVRYLTRIPERVTVKLNSTSPRVSSRWIRVKGFQLTWRRQCQTCPTVITLFPSFT